MAAAQPDKSAGTAREDTPDTGGTLLPLGIAITLALLLTIYPPILSTPAGKADHVAATLALCSMSSGFIRGVGFMPRNRVLRALFSTTACLVCLVLSAAMMAHHGIAS